MRRLYYSLVDSIRSLLGHHDPLLPSRELIDSVGGGDFKAVGQEFFCHFTQVGGLKPNDHVLDVGSGCGRMAVPLMSYLSDKGGYWGFDIMENGVRWCEQHITPRRPNFHFLLADVYNRCYNPNGKYKPNEFKFPYDSQSFDFVFLTSVFTHMLAPDMQNYLAEISRVMRPGARCITSFFLLNTDARNLMTDGASSINFKCKLPDCYSSREDIPEGAIAFDEQYVRERFPKQGLRIIEPIHFGSWCGRNQYLSYQDIVLATKTAG